MEYIPDLRRWVSGRTAGISRLLFHAHASLYDATGAIRAGQTYAAAYAARELVLLALSIHGLASGVGEIDWGAPPDDIAFDPFEGVDADIVRNGLELVAAVFDEPDGEKWLDSLRDFIDQAEAVLRLGEPLPDVRSPDGQFAALAIGRPYVELATELGIPIAAVITEYAFDD
jgi:hypothetical protein